MRCMDIRSANATKTVSSPAMLPTTSGQRVRSSAAAIAWAEPGPQPLLAGALGLGDPCRHDVRLDPVLARLDEAQLGDVAADRRLGGTEAAIPQRGRKFLLRADRLPAQKVADLALAQLLHYFH